MQIKLTSNRKFFTNIFIMFSTLTFLLVCILMFIDGFSGNFLILLICLSILELIFITLLIISYTKSKPEYIFNNEKIIIKKKNKISEISIEDITRMTFYSFKWYYWFLFAFFILLGDTGAGYTPSICIERKNGEKTLIGYFSKHDIQSLIPLYSNLLVIK